MEPLSEKPKKRQAKKDAKKAQANSEPVTNIAKDNQKTGKSTSSGNDTSNNKDAFEGLELTPFNDSINRDTEDRWWSIVLDNYDLDNLPAEDPIVKGNNDDDEELPSGEGNNEGGTDREDPDKVVKKYENELDEIDRDILYYLGELNSYIKRAHRRKGVVAQKDIEDYYKDLERKSEKVEHEFELAKAKKSDYESFLSPEKVEDWFKTNLPSIYTKTAVAKAKKRKSERSGMQAEQIISNAKKALLSSLKHQEIIELVLDILKQSGVKSESLKGFLSNPDILKHIVDGFKNYEFDAGKYKKKYNLKESIKSDISKMWVVKNPTKKGMQVDSLLSHASFDNMYTMYGEGVTSDDIYGVYFDKTKARNIAKRIINKYDRDNSPIEPSEEIIEEARKKRKKKKKKKTKKKSTRRPKRTKSIIRTDYTYIPAMRDDSGSAGDMGGDAGGGE